ncbi:MAG: dephospho-CoA kinase [Betaproteobacteria bacterium]|jgi:dephospho-CoA kinase
MAGYVVGVTGGIGSGKTTVTDCFADLGIVIADADEASRKIVEPGQPVLDAITEYFSKDILDETGRLNRKKLREIIFNDVSKRKALEGLTHRPIMDELRRQLYEAKGEYVMLVLSAGLGKSPLIQRMLVVDAEEPIRIQRVMIRDGSSEALIRQIINSQPSSEERLTIADDVVENNSDIDQVRADVSRLHARYLELARA